MNYAYFQFMVKLVLEIKVPLDNKQPFARQIHGKCLLLEYIALGETKNLLP